MTKIATTAIKSEVLDVLSRCRVEDNKVFLPDEQLERKLYLDVNKVLSALGGKWNRSAKAHLFPDPVGDNLELVVASGSFVDMKKTLQAFYTPEEVATQMRDLLREHVRRSGLDFNTLRVLEPSAGAGALINGLPDDCKIMAVDLNKKDLDKITHPQVVKFVDDFLKLRPTDPEKFDAVLMNPPFTRGQDIAHIQHAFKFLRSGGVLVGICSEGPFFRTDKKAEAFREWLEENGETVELSEGAFKASGTMVRTRIVCIRKD